MTTVATPDPADTIDCPLAPCCELCGSPRRLAVSVADSFAGCFCITLCAGCDQGLLPAIRPLDALTRCSRHAEHLGLDLDQLAALSDGAE